MAESTHNKCKRSLAKENADPVANGEASSKKRLEQEVQANDFFFYLAFTNVGYRYVRYVYRISRLEKLVAPSILTSEGTAHR